MIKHCALHPVQPGTRDMHKMSNSLLVSVAMEYFPRISMILCINKIHNFFMATSIFNKRFTISYIPGYIEILYDIETKFF